MLRSPWSPAAVLLVLMMAVGSVVMWIGVPLGLIYLASQIADSSRPSAGPYLLVLIGLPIGMALVGKCLGTLDRLHGRLTGRHEDRRRATLAALDARRAPAEPPRRRARPGDADLGRRSRWSPSPSGSSASRAPRLPTA